MTKWLSTTITVNQLYHKVIVRHTTTTALKTNHIKAYHDIIINYVGIKITII